MIVLFPLSFESLINMHWAGVLARVVRGWFGFRLMVFAAGGESDLYMCICVYVS